MFSGFIGPYKMKQKAKGEEQTAFDIIQFEENKMGMLGGAVVVGSVCIVQNSSILQRFSSLSRTTVKA